MKKHGFQRTGNQAQDRGRWNSQEDGKTAMQNGPDWSRRTDRNMWVETHFIELLRV